MVLAVVVLFYAIGPALWLDTAGGPLPLTVVQSSKQGPLYTVTLENRGSKPASAWTLEVRAETGADRMEVFYSGKDVFRSTVLRRLGVRAIDKEDAAVIAPGARGVDAFFLPESAVLRQVAVISVIFEDGTSMGDERFLRPMFQKRESLASTCDRWTDVVDLASRLGDATAEVSALSAELTRARQRGAGRATDDDVPALIDDALRAYETSRSEFESRMRFVREYLREMSAEGRRHIK